MERDGGVLLSAAELPASTAMVTSSVVEVATVVGRNGEDEAIDEAEKSAKRLFFTVDEERRGVEREDDEDGCNDGVINVWAG